MRKWLQGLPVALALIAAATALYFGGYLLPDRFHTPLEHLAIALFVAGILAWLVDGPLRWHLAQDVFKTVAGYPLPPELQEEVRHVMGQRILCEKFEAKYALTLLQNGDVAVRIETERRLKNFGGYHETIEIKLGIEEWFRGAESEIHYLRYKIEDGPIRDVPLPSKKRKAGRELRGDSKTLCRSQAITIWGALTEIKSRNDLSVFHSLYATTNPRVVVDVPEGFEKKVTFAHPEKLEAGGDEKTFDLPATLLPQQTIVVRWWERSKDEAWQAGTIEAK